LFIKNYTAIRARVGVGTQNLTQKEHPFLSYLPDFKWIYIPETFLFPN